MPLTGTREVVATVKVAIAAQVCVIVAIKLLSRRSSADSAALSSITM